MSSDPTKKDKILAAAIEVFSEQGIEKTKISDVVKRAGVAQGTFYLYFSSKQSLVPAIAEQLLEEQFALMQQHVTSKLPFLKQIEKMVETTFLVTNQYKDVLALCYSGLAIGGLSEWEKIYEPYYNWVDQLLEQAMLRGEVRENINLRVTTKLLVGLMEEAAEQLYIFDDNDEQADVYIKETIEFLKRALIV